MDRRRAQSWVPLFSDVWPQGLTPSLETPVALFGKWGESFARVPGLSSVPGWRLLPVVGRRFGLLSVLTPWETRPLPPHPPRGRHLPVPGDHGCSHGRKWWGQRGPFSTLVTEITNVRTGGKVGLEYAQVAVFQNETLRPREHRDLLSTHLTAIEPERRQRTLPGTHQQGGATARALALGPGHGAGNGLVHH